MFLLDVGLNLTSVLSDSMILKVHLYSCFTHITVPLGLFGFVLDKLLYPKLQYFN